MKKWERYSVIFVWVNIGVAPTILENQWVAVSVNRGVGGCMNIYKTIRLQSN